MWPHPYWQRVKGGVSEHLVGVRKCQGQATGCRWLPLQCHYLPMPPGGSRCCWWTGWGKHKFFCVHHNDVIIVLIVSCLLWLSSMWVHWSCCLLFCLCGENEHCGQRPLWAGLSEYMHMSGVLFTATDTGLFCCCIINIYIYYYVYKLKSEKHLCISHREYKSCLMWT